MVSMIKDIKCKNCSRTPSYMGKEPMYLIPVPGMRHIVLCGKCFSKLLENLQRDGLFDMDSSIDYSNLFTYIPDEMWNTIFKNI